MSDVLTREEVEALCVRYGGIGVAWDGLLASHEALRARAEKSEANCSALRSRLAAATDALRMCADEIDCAHIMDGDGSGQRQCDYCREQARKALAAIDAAERKEKEE